VSWDIILWPLGSEESQPIALRDEPPERYECDRCGACCKHTLQVDLTPLDIAREPKLKDVAVPDGDSLDDPWEYGGALLLRPDCPLLGGDNLCTIHATKPSICAGFPAGSEGCQEARAAVGLPPLEPISIQEAS
jgi:Fe-S-cluster containining protein